MANPTRIEVCCCGNCSAEGHPKESIIELTDAEVAELAVLAAEAEARKAEEDAAAQAAAEAKASAEAKLAALGLSADEIAALSK